MGRKIPGRKHRGIKDRFKQIEERQAKLETKINAPPKNADEQAVPKSLERVVKLKELAKSGRISKVKKKKKKKTGLICVGAEKTKPLHPKAKPEKVVPIFQQRPGESANHFMYRVGKDTHAFLSETAFEKKFGVQVNRDPQTGKIDGLSKCKKSTLDKIDMLQLKHKNINKKKKNINKCNMTKSQKRKEKLRLKKEEKEEEEVDEFEHFKDDVKFGEVVHEPPQLKTRPKNVDSKSIGKPGRKELLLHSLLQSNETSKENTAKKLVIDRAGKRKNLPVGERRQLEKQQNEVIAAYRRLKAQQLASNNS